MGALLALASTILLLATVAGSLPARGPAFDTAAHFMLQYAICALVLFVLSLLTTPGFSTMACVISLVLALYQLSPYALPRADATHTGTTVRILQSNMLFTNRRIGGLMSAIEADNPDIIVIAEANGGHAAYLRDIMRLYPHQAGTPQQKNPYGMVIASRLPIDNVQAHHFVHDLIVAYSFDISLDGKAVTVLSVHPSNPLKNIGLRDRELVVMSRWIRAQSNPVIVTGDFNITPYAQAYKDFIRATDLKNARLGRGVFHGTYHTRLPKFTRIPIDHTLYSDALTVVDYKTFKIDHTDHLGTMVTLGFAQ